VDEAASRRAPGGMALRDWQTGWQGSLGWKAAFLGRVVNASYSEPDPTSTRCYRRSIAVSVVSSAGCVTPSGGQSSLGEPQYQHRTSRRACGRMALRYLAWWSRTETRLRARLRRSNSREGSRRHPAPPSQEFSRSVDAVQLLFVRKVPFLVKGVASACLRKTAQGAAFPGFIP
jgi:hypothetical protein